MQSSPMKLSGFDLVSATCEVSSTEAERKERETQRKEEQYWREAEGSTSRAARRRQDDAKKRSEAAARRAENRQIAEQERLELDKAGRKPDKKANRMAISAPKVREAELQQRREEERERILKGMAVTLWRMRSRGWLSRSPRSRPIGTLRGGLRRHSKLLKKQSFPR